MIPVSNAWVQMMNVRTNFIPSASILLAGGSTITVNIDDIVGLKLGESGGGGALPVGFAICRTCELELVNADGRFDDVVFAGAEVTVSLSYNTGSATETILMGTYTVKQPGTSGTSIILPCEDDMAKADKLFETTLTAPTTAGALWADICTSCGITGQQNIPQASYAIQTLPSGEISFRQVLGDIAMLSGGNARVDRDRTLKVVNYDFATLEDARDEGTVPAGMHNLALWKTLSNDTEDITITGVSTTKENADGGFDIVTVGTDDNVLTVSNSVIAGNELAAMTSLGAAINGAVYRPFSGEHVSYPIAEFGDIAHVTDGLGIEFYTVITDIAWEAWTVTTIAASAEVNDGTGAGTLSQRMTKITADIAEIKRLKVDKADIGEAIIDTLEAEGVNADWINAGRLNAEAVIIETEGTPGTALNTLGFEDGKIIIYRTGRVMGYIGAEPMVYKTEEGGEGELPLIVDGIENAVMLMLKRGDTDHDPDYGQTLYFGFEDYDGTRCIACRMTMNGEVAFDYAVDIGGRLSFRDKNINSYEAHASSYWGQGHQIRFLDAFGNDIGHLRPFYTASNEQGVYIEATRDIRGTAYNNYLRLAVDGSGNRKVLLDPAPWRKALGVSSVQSKTVTGTTDANGFITLNLANGSYIPLVARSSRSDDHVEFTTGSSSWWGRVTNKGAARANASVTIEVHYTDKP